MIKKKARKNKGKRKKRARFSGVIEYSRRVRLIKNAKHYPLHECLIDKEWQDRGLAQILLSRRQPNNKLIFGVYLVDTYCLGLRNTFCNADISPEEYQRMKLTTFREAVLVPCSPEKVCKIIFGAVEYARGLGFTPHRDFALSRLVLEGLAEKECDFELEFGREGKPLYIAGLHDDFNTIIETLKKNVGEGNFDFIVPLPLK
ncbi:MAG: hypothetical protein ACE5L7_12015 [Candidatus Aminicenantales bacterium]